MKTPIRVLIVEDSEDDAMLTVRELRRGPYEVTFERVQLAASMDRALAETEWDVIITDWMMPEFSALEALSLARTRSPDTPSLVVSGTVGEETAVAAMQAGARDFVLKGKLTRLLSAVERELKESRARKRAAEALQNVEAQLRQAQKMEAVGRLAGGIAHDFNNYIGVILGYADLARTEVDPSHRVRAHLDEIVRAAERTSAVTRQLLTFSRKQVTRPRLLDLNEVLTGTHRLLGPLLGEGVALDVIRAGDLGRVRADLGQMEQIVLNLALNARDAMPDGGRLTLETSNVELGVADVTANPLTPPGRYVVLSITDNGIGMDEETQRHLFEPFFTTKPAGEGTGLGLATVHGIVTQSGGHIWVASELGQGTTFKVYLPRVDEPAEVAAPADPTQAAPVGGKETILVVEDSEALQRLIRTTLEQRGWKVLLAGNGEEALALASEHQAPIDLLLSDVVMPKLGGVELAKRLGALRPRLRVLFMSGYASDTVLNASVLGDRPLLEKPFTLDRLIGAVREALDQPAQPTA